MKISRTSQNVRNSFHVFFSRKTQDFLVYLLFFHFFPKHRAQMQLQGKNEGRLLLLRTGRKIESSVIYWNFPDQSVNLDMIFKVIHF